MGLRPNRTNENRHRLPRAGGGPCPEELDPRLRGNDVGGARFRKARSGRFPERSNLDRKLLPVYGFVPMRRRGRSPTAPA